MLSKTPFCKSIHIRRNQFQFPPLNMLSIKHLKVTRSKVIVKLCEKHGSLQIHFIFFIFVDICNNATDDAKEQLLLYISTKILGALLGSLFVKYVIGDEAFLGANSPNHAYPLPLIFGVEILASALLMAVILMVVFTKGLRGFGGNSHWRDCWLGHILFRVYVRRINESCSFIGPCFVVWEEWWKICSCIGPPLLLETPIIATTFSGKFWHILLL